MNPRSRAGTVPDSRHGDCPGWSDRVAESRDCARTTVQVETRVSTTSGTRPATTKPTATRTPRTAMSTRRGLSASRRRARGAAHIDQTPTIATSAAVADTQRKPPVPTERQMQRERNVEDTEPRAQGADHETHGHDPEASERLVEPEPVRQPHRMTGPEDRGHHQDRRPRRKTFAQHVLEQPERQQLLPQHRHGHPDDVDPDRCRQGVVERQCDRESRRDRVCPHLL